MAKGTKIPKQFRKVIDEIKSEVVEEIFQDAGRVQQDLQSFKDKSYKAISDYMELLASEYNVTYEGKGNITLTNYDSTLMIRKEIHNFIKFDEKLQIAKSLIDKCINKWSGGADDKIKVLVYHAFEVDKQGKINTERVLGLRRLNIADTDWQRAMEVISESVSVTHSKSYIRLYKRADEYEAWEQVSLNMATL